MTFQHPYQRSSGPTNTYSNRATNSIPTGANTPTNACSPTPHTPRALEAPLAAWCRRLFHAEGRIELVVPYTTVTGKSPTGGLRHNTVAVARKRKGRNARSHPGVTSYGNGYLHRDLRDASPHARCCVDTGRSTRRRASNWLIEPRIPAVSEASQHAVHPSGKHVGFIRRGFTRALSHDLSHSWKERRASQALAKRVKDPIHGVCRPSRPGGVGVGGDPSALAIIDVLVLYRGASGNFPAAGPKIPGGPSRENPAGCAFAGLAGLTGAFSGCGALRPSSNRDRGPVSLSRAVVGI